MEEYMNVLAVIPARAGSKSVVNKNIRDFNGKPMLAYSIEHALASKHINRVILSTDSPEYALIGEKYGAEIKILTFPYIDLSSTDIRQRIRTNKSVRYMLPDATLSYIEKNRLYRDHE